MDFRKILSSEYWHRKYYDWLKRRTSMIWAWPLSRERYFHETGKKLSYRNPDDIDQKLMWLNRYDDDPRRSEYADKYMVRFFVEKCGYGEALIPLIGVWVCTDKRQLDIEAAKYKLNKWLHECYDDLLQEKHYRKIKPKIICEKYLEQLNSGIVDYKFHCFKGKVHSCFVAYNRDKNNPLGSVCFDHYDINWNLTEAIKSEYHINRRFIEKPKCYDYMLQMCSALSKDFDYVRVDLYEIEGKVYFGEMTFTPNGCIESFYRQSMLDILGNQLQLPSNKRWV